MSSTQAGPSRRRRGSDDDRMRRSEVFTSVDPREKHKIASKYTALQGNVDTMRNNIENIAPDDLLGVLKKTDQYYQVRDTDIANQDARVVRETAEMSAALLRKQKLGGASFDIDEMLALVGRHLELEDEPQNREEDELEDDDEPRRNRRRNLGAWEKIGWMASQVNRRVAGIEFLNGPLEVEHNRKEKRVRQRQEIAPEQRPIEIQTQGAKKSNDPTLTNVRSVAKCLAKADSRGEGVNFFEFVCNPDSFSQTVENCFYVSFLVREGKAGIDVGDDDLVMIYHREPRTEDDDEDDDGDGQIGHQAVMELDMATWREAIELFDLKNKPRLIPTRAPADIAGPSANGWYGA